MEHRKDMVDEKKYCLLRSIRLNYDNHKRIRVKKRNFWAGAGNEIDRVIKCLICLELLRKLIVINYAL